MRAVIFDVGRVLVHWDPEATLAGLSEISQAGPAELRLLIGQISHDLGAGALQADAFHRYLIDHAESDENWGLFYTAFCRGVRRDDAALAYAAHLTQRGVPVGIISNTNAVHVQWLHVNLPELVAFHPVVWSSDVGLLKPDPAIYKLAIRKMNVAATQALFIDDLEQNVAGATAAGLAGWVHRNWEETRQVIEGWLNT